MRVRMSGTDILTFIVLCIKCVSHGFSAYNDIGGKGCHTDSSHIVFLTSALDMIGRTGK